MQVHQVAELFPMMRDSELQELADNIKANGLMQPIVVKDEVLLDGRNRLAACKMVGVKPYFREFAGGDEREFIISANLHRRHLNESQRAMIAAKLANMKIGDNQHTGGSANLDTLPMSLKKSANSLSVGRTMVADAKIIQREAPELAKKVEAGEITVHAAKEAIRPHVANNSGDNEWYTPKPIIEAARNVMGNIELDPASTSEANKVIKAQNIHTKEDNGLKQDWAGKLWLKPPYASDLVGKFIDKLAESVESGAVKEALVLVNNATETKWFARLASISSFLCFPNSRIKYWHLDKTTAAPLQGQCVAYIGKNGKRFCAEFKAFGVVVEII